MPDYKGSQYCVGFYNQHLSCPSTAILLSIRGAGSAGSGVLVLGVSAASKGYEEELHAEHLSNPSDQPCKKFKNGRDGHSDQGIDAVAAGEPPPTLTNLLRSIF